MANFDTLLDKEAFLDNIKPYRDSEKMNCYLDKHSKPVEINHWTEHDDKHYCGACKPVEEKTEELHVSLFCRNCEKPITRCRCYSKQDLKVPEKLDHEKIIAEQDSYNIKDLKSAQAYWIATVFSKINEIIDYLEKLQGKKDHV